MLTQKRFVRKLKNLTFRKLEPPSGEIEALSDPKKILWPGL